MKDVGSHADYSAHIIPSYENTVRMWVSEKQEGLEKYLLLA